MNETCDRCGPAVYAVYAVYRVNREGELYLCRHCTNQLWPTLSGSRLEHLAHCRVRARKQAQKALIPARYGLRRYPGPCCENGGPPLIPLLPPGNRSRKTKAGD
jgi:hypothetical protein